MHMHVHRHARKYIHNQKDFLFSLFFSSLCVCVPPSMVSTEEFGPVPGFLCITNLAITHKTVTLACLLKKQYLRGNFFPS